MNSIPIEDLRIGDEIVIAGGGSRGGGMLYLRVLRMPRLAAKPDYNGNPYYRTILCSYRQEEKSYSRTYQGQVYTYKRTNTVFTPEDHNKERYFNLNGKTILFMKGEAR